MNFRFRRKFKTGWLKVDEKHYIKGEKLINALKTGVYTVRHIIAASQEKDCEPLHFEAELKQDEIVVLIGSRNEPIKSTVPNMLGFLQSGKTLNQFLAQFMKLDVVKKFGQIEEIKDDPEQVDISEHSTE